MPLLLRFALNGSTTRLSTHGLRHRILRTVLDSASDATTHMLPIRPCMYPGPVKRDDQGFTSKSWDCVVLGRLAYDHWVTVDQHHYNHPFKDLCVMVIIWGEDGELAERIGLVNLGHRIWDDACEN